MGTKNVVGVDIGHSSVKVVGLRLGKKPVFLGCKEITMDPRYLQKEGFENAELIGKALKEAMETAAPKAIPSNSLAYSAVSESLAFRKIMELPKLKSESELVEAVRLEVAQFLPENADSMEIDYRILASGGDDAAQQVMAVAVNKKIIQEYMTVFASAKLAIKAVDAKPEAIGRALVSPDEKEAILLVDIGSELSTVSLYDGGTVWVTGSLNMGGNIIRNKDTGEVEEDKREQSMKRLADGLADEISHVVKFYLNRTLVQHKIKEIRLSGGGSMIAGIPEALAAVVDFSVEIGTAVIDLPPFCDRRFLGALGCALYSLAEDPS